MRGVNAPAVFVPALIAFVVLLAGGHKALSEGTNPAVATGVLCFVVSLLLGLLLLVGMTQELS